MEMTIEETLALFMAAPEREFTNNRKQIGFFQVEFVSYHISKSIVKKLVKKGMLIESFVTMQSGRYKGSQLTFYSTPPTKVNHE